VQARGGPIELALNTGKCNLRQGPHELSRRDGRTQPGVLTPGRGKKRGSALKKGRQENLPGGSPRENRLHWTTLPPFRAGSFDGLTWGLKPQAESCHPFGISSSQPLTTGQLQHVSWLFELHANRRPLPRQDPLHRINHLSHRNPIHTPEIDRTLP
jgi:hypothetical protein